MSTPDMYANWRNPRDLTSFRDSMDRGFMVMFNAGSISWAGPLNLSHWPFCDPDLTGLPPLNWHERVDFELEHDQADTLAEILANPPSQYQLRFFNEPKKFRWYAGRWH